METMKKKDDIEELLKSFEEAGIKRTEALKKNKSRIANVNYDKMIEIVKRLRTMNALPELARFYEHPDIHFRILAAAYLLPVYEERSIRVLQEISEMKGLKNSEAFCAEMTIQEWEKGHLRNFYTL